MPQELLIRLATMDDLPAINAIYNHYVQCSTCTYQTENSTPEERLAWFNAHGPQHPATVGLIDGIVVGWCSLSKFHPRAAYGHSVESSIYIHHACHRRGLGKALMQDILRRAREIGHHTVLAGISADQTASIALHTQLGFTTVAHFKEVGFKFNRWLDVVWMQLML